MEVVVLKFPNSLEFQVVVDHLKNHHPVREFSFLLEGAHVLCSKKLRELFPKGRGHVPQAP